MIGNDRSFEKQEYKNTVFGDRPCMLKEFVPNLRANAVLCCDRWAAGCRRVIGRNRSLTLQDWEQDHADDVFGLGQGHNCVRRIGVCGLQLSGVQPGGYYRAVDLDVVFMCTSGCQERPQVEASSTDVFAHNMQAGNVLRRFSTRGLV